MTKIKSGTHRTINLPAGREVKGIKVFFLINLHALMVFWERGLGTYLFCHSI